MLSQLCVFRLGLLQDRNVGVGVFPQQQKIIVGTAGLGGVAGKSVGAPKLQMRERANGSPFDTIPRWSKIFWNSAAAWLP